MLSPEEKKLADDAVIVLSGALGQIPNEKVAEFKSEITTQLGVLNNTDKPTPVQLVGAALNLVDDIAHVSGDSPAAQKFQHVMDVIAQGFETFLEGKFNLFTAVSTWLKAKKAVK